MDTLSPHDISVLQAYLARSFGLTLPADKFYLLEKRLQSVMHHHALADLTALADMIRTQTLPATLAQAIIDAMTINETSFFRDFIPFDAFREEMIPTLLHRRAASRHIRIWSAACAAGQESYSLAIILDQQRAILNGWHVDLLGTDICSTVLTQARQGIYSQFEIQRGLPAPLLARYFNKTEERNWQIRPEIVRMVQYESHNLLESFAGFGSFDIIFCRNVLLYFAEAQRLDVLKRLHAQLAPDGYLVLGGTETTRGLPALFTPHPNYCGVFRPL